MKISACVLALAAGLALPAAAENFVNLDFDVPELPPPVLGEFVFLSWDEAAPGWNHSDGDSTEYVYRNSGHLGYSQYYVLIDGMFSPFGPASGSFAMGLRSGSEREHEPRGEFVQSFVSQHGLLPAASRSLSLLASSFQFEVRLNGHAIDLRPVGLDPASPTYEEDFLTYSGEWTGDVSSFAGQIVELKILNNFPSLGGTSPWTLIVDEIRFLPVPEPSTTALLSVGVLALMLRRRWAWWLGPVGG